MASFDEHNCRQMKDTICDFQHAQYMRADWSFILDDEILQHLDTCSQALECAVDTLALPFLALVAAQIGDCACKVNSDWVEPLRAWFIIIARKGEKKTTVCNRLRAEVQSKKHDENANSEICDGDKLSKICQLNDFLNKTVETAKSNDYFQDHLIMVDNLERHISKQESIKTLQSIFLTTDESSGCARSFIGMCQAQSSSDLISSLCDPDSLGNIDKFVVCCASDFDGREISNEKYIPLLPILQAIRKSHDHDGVAFREYVLSSDAEEEFCRIKQKLHELKRRYIYDEIRRGCLNQTPGHVIHFSTILTALANRGNHDRQSFVIGSRMITKSFLFVLELLRHKFVLIPYTFHDDSNDTTIFDMILTSERMRYLKTMMSDRKRDTAPSNEVIEITLDGNDEPIARIIPKQLPHSSSTSGATAVSVSMPEDRNLLREGYTGHNQTQDEPMADNVDVPSASHLYDGFQSSDQVDEKDDDDQRITSVSSPNSTNQPIFPDRMMVSYNNSMKESPRELRLPPLKIRPPQALSGRPKVAAPKRVVERVRNNVKNDIYTCSDELFIHQCALKIKKSMLTPGNIITSSYACQYRLFPPVPLVQRTSSPRTTHPSWAAVKFFERLQKLGLGEVLVFRSQSIKFRKKLFDDMSEETRALLRTVGVEEEDYRDALMRTGNMDIRPGSRDYNEYATMVQNGAFFKK